MILTLDSILFEKAEDRPRKEPRIAPDFFDDLNLDQIIDAITAEYQEYDLEPFFYAPLDDVRAIKYRHEIFRDLQDQDLFAEIKSFAQQMVVVRRYFALVDKLTYKNHQEGWFLEAAEAYCKAVTSLVDSLVSAGLISRGLTAFREYMTDYADSEAFMSLLAETEELKDALSTVKYLVLIQGSTVRVRKYEGEIDYSTEVQKTFEKFKQGAPKDYRVQLTERSGMNHVEAQILDFVARLFPDIFSSLEHFCARHSDFLDETISTFDREIQFYVAYLDHMASIERAGLRFCYPRISPAEKEVFNYDGYDLALARKCISENSPIVCNDFHLKGKERILVVSGPNQGGKTTFARTFGQLHYLARLGCPVPGREAQLFLYDRLFTHFEREENIQNLRGKLQDDLVRIHGILDQATPDSIIIINEIFTSTTAGDAAFLGKEVLARIVEIDVPSVYVTFVDELATLSEKTVSVVSTVVPENPALRTYKIVRRPADGLAYAMSIAEKHRLTYEHLKERITS